MIVKDITPYGKRVFTFEQLTDLLTKILPDKYPNLYEYLNWVLERDGENAHDACISLVVLFAERNDFGVEDNEL